MRMAEDYVRRGFSQDDAEALVFYDLSDRLSVLQYNLSDRIRPPPARPELPVLEVNWEWHSRKGEEMYNSLNDNQRAAADNILQMGSTNRRKLHFVDGPGGSGKTYLYNAIYHVLNGRRKRVICVAWTGIAASLLPHGRTASSTFKLNMRADNRECSLKREDRDATPLKEADAIIWDEISMVPKFALEAVDLLLQDLMCNNIPFGGKTVVLGGDFRQTLPIIEKGRESDMVDACVKNSHLWRRFLTHHLTTNMRVEGRQSPWSALLMTVGNGEAEQDVDGKIELPSEVFSDGNIIDEVFGDQLTNVDCLSDRAILAPRNLEVDHINQQALDKLPGAIYVYRSIDEVAEDEHEDEDLYPSEFLNSLSPAGLPLHCLKLKEGAVVLLLRNLDVKNGLCNGTRLIATHFGRYVLGCRFASGQRKGQFILIPRIDNYTEKGVPFKLRRRQFPLRLAFAMTINKAQGQSLTNVGIHLRDDVFSHGQLYVALSRSRSKEGVKVVSNGTRVKNIVIKSVLN
ncbi:hypothetical protein OESDEN_06491 [Oesophagostomum dentatum]|uniref:ATP-dependent DNA helicase n=1 Tax=Oesophagostomum dentatum TaxID=61180 RepID=A0A0B1TBV6_OESDE|nr:hypothetical protein OESDEN_06491 [Oesophagostomum dentatum]